MDKNKRSTSITIDQDVLESIRLLAEADDRSLSSYLNRTLTRYTNQPQVAELLKKLKANEE